MRRRFRMRGAWVAVAMAFFVFPPAVAVAAGFHGRVLGDDGHPVVGAMVTFRTGDPPYEMTVLSDDAGRFESADLVSDTRYAVRVRRIGWKDLRVEEKLLPPNGQVELELRVEREADPAAVAAQLPANYWWGLVLERVEDEGHREQLVRQCTFCHQQGNLGTRIQREDWRWEKVLDLMSRMGAGLDPEIRAQVPALFNAAYHPDNAVPKLTREMGEPGFAPPPGAAARRAVIEEYVLGGRASVQHDITVHPDGRIYSVDMMQDILFRLDPSVPGGQREAFPLPDDGLPLNGVFGTASVMPPNSNAHVGPHSLQVAPDGGIWITLALGNRLAHFDPATENWTIEILPDGLYPHTLRFDSRGRIWYTIAVSNHLGMYDPASGRHEVIRLPARSWGEAIALRTLPLMLWMSKTFDVSLGATEGEGLPVPYGVDIAPDGSVWFSQLNAHKIGRVDPDTLEVTMLDTPFTAPRRMRFDSKGNLWIPGFSSSLLARFNPETQAFRTWELPIEPLGTETPYALNVDRRSDTVWICGTSSDTLIRFEPESQTFTIYPLPTRVSYTRELDFDESGAVWTSNSNVPAWQIETGLPRVIRLDPRIEGSPRTSAAAPARGPRPSVAATASPSPRP